MLSAKLTANLPQLPRRNIVEGTFPPQLRISTNGTGWHESDINRWIENPVAWRSKTYNEFDFDD